MKKTVILTFNKNTGIYSGLIHAGESNNIQEGDLNTSTFEYKTVQLDPETETWSGTYSDGQIIKIEEQPVEVTEYDIDTKTQTKIFQKYRYYNQINILMNIIDSLRVVLDPKTDASFEDIDFSDYDKFKQDIGIYIDKGKKSKEKVIKNSDYIYKSKEEVDKEFKEMYNGDLRDMIEPEHPSSVLI